MVDPTEPGLPSADDSARAVFLAWERLRLVYNAALGAVVLACAAGDLSDREFRSFLLRDAVAANLCFCFGPVAEGYLALVGVGRRAARYLVFVPGLLLGCFFALVALTFRNFD